MPATEPLCNLIGIDLTKLTKQEIYLLESELFLKIYAELKEYFKNKNKQYFKLLKLTFKQEDIIVENKLVYLIVQDILSTKEYDIDGIALYSRTHVDVIEDIYKEKNLNPSTLLFYKLLDLHRSVRRDFYQKITEKIIFDYLALTSVRRN